MWVSGKVAKKTQWNDKLFSLYIEADIPPYQAGQFIKLGTHIDERRIARAYSIVNAPDETLLEVLFIEVEDGKLTPHLKHLQQGDEIEVSQASGFMTLAEIPQNTKDLWLLSTGTAVGPFLSMLRTPEPWERFDNIVLVYGVRLASDLAYIEELQQLASANNKLKLVLSVTRETYKDTLRCRIPEAIQSGQLEQAAKLSLSQDRSHIILCGNPGMIKDVESHLLEQGFQKHSKRNPGQISMERYW